MPTPTLNAGDTAWMAGPAGAVLIGAVSGAVCFFAATSVKRALGYDDSLDAFGVHAVGGFLGTILAGLCASPALGGSKADVVVASQVGIQLVGATVGAVWSAVVAWIALEIAAALVGVRVDEGEESQGLDLALHNEAGYNL
jgi:Amt family ammonium transporter